MEVVEKALVLSKGAAAVTTGAGFVGRDHGFALLPAVKNGYNDHYMGNDLFDLSYADASTC